MTIEKFRLTIGANLCSAREDRGYTQQQLAQACGVDSTIISRIETGHRFPSLVTLWRILRVLKISFGEVLDQKIN